MTDSALRTIPFTDAKGEEKTLDDLGADVVLVVNVASKCGLTPQYEQLEELQRLYGDRGFTVVGFPCNQFFGQEPGSVDEILEFCSTTYGVSFPVNDKVKVNGKNASELYRTPAGRPVVWSGTSRSSSCCRTGTSCASARSRSRTPPRSSARSRRH
jgi:glutathione peroxidase